MPVPFDLAPEPSDALAQAPFGRIRGVEELACAEKALEQEGGLDDVAAIVLAAERNGRAGAPVQEMRKEPVIGGGALQKGEHGVQPRRRFFARDKTPCDGDDNRHDAEAAAADGDKIVLRIGLKAGPVPREKADRMRALPEKGETPPLHEIKQRVVGKSRGSCLRQRNSSPPDAGM